MKYKFIFVSILVFSELFGLSAQAEQIFTLKEAILFAFENNNEIKSFGYLVSAEKSDINIQKSHLLPKVKFEEGFVNTNNPTEALTYRLDQRRVTAQSLELNNMNNPAPISNWLTGIYLEQPIIDKKLLANLAIAKIEYSAETLEYMRKKEEIAQNVAIAYFEVEKDKSIITAIEKNIENSQENLNTAKKMYEERKAFYSAVLRAETELNETKQKMISAQKNLEISKRGLGLELGETKSIETNNQNPPEIKLKETNYYDLSSMGRNDIKSSQMKYEKAKKNIKLAESAYYPTMFLASSYRTYDNSAPFGWQGNNYFVGSFLRWELYDGAKRKNEKLKAQSLANSAFEDLENIKKKVSFQVYSAYTKVEENSENLKLMKEAYQTAEEGRNIVLGKYKTGALNLVDLLDTQKRLNETRTDVIIQENNCIDSLIKLSFESGTLLRDLEIYQDK